jgi:putative Ca2+/H+ antiporter (TMEM165/GDT1 family)
MQAITGDDAPAAIGGRAWLEAAPFQESAMRQLLVIFTTVVLAELGDKTQLATLLFAADEKAPSPMLVFLAAAGALVLSTAIAVIAGIGFIAIGVWTVTAHFRGA